MPLLLCPNDNGSMQTVQRSGVEFDMCPACRGVWLDRGELEKLLSLARDDTQGDPRTQYQTGTSQFNPAAPMRPDQSRAWDDDGQDHRPAKRRSSFFDVFD